MALFKHFFKNRDGLSFVQIGANDGVDFVRERVLTFGWRGVFVEPIPHIFKRLKETYRGVGGLAFENVAIAESAGTKDFHVCDGHEVCSGLEIVHPKVSRHPFHTIRVKCITISQLFERYGIERLDVLVIDTEGYDGKIIKSMDFNVRPKVLIYESKDLPDNDEVRALLKGQGYKFRPFSNNTVAYLK